MPEKWEIFLKKELRRLDKLAVLGTGNALKADDAAGLLVANLLDNHLSRYQKSKIKILRAYEIIDLYLKKIKRIKPSHLIIIDAIDLGRKPGSIITARIGPAKKRKKRVGGEFYAFLEKLSADTSCRIYLVGVQPETLDFGHPVTPSIKEACRQIVDFIAHLVPRKAR
jgi:hydrogenase 3 maturation protease